MIYVKSSGKYNRLGVNLMFRRFLFRLGRWLMRLSSPNIAISDKAIALYNLDAGNAASAFNPETRRKLEQAAEDFEAAVAGLPPIHAHKEGGFLDGGTTIWQGEGYSITLMKSMTTVGDIHGYMVGPVLKLDYPLAHGNTTEMSHVTFYTQEALDEFLRGK
jgi:hypothetical protein